MTSPVPSCGSGTVSIASGDPNAFKTAAFMGPPHFRLKRILAGLQGPNKTWYYPRIMKPSYRHGTHGGIRHEFEAERTRRLPAVAAAEADAEGGRPAGGPAGGAEAAPEGGRPAGGPAAAHARPAARGGGRARRHRRRLVRPPRAGTIR